MMIIVIAVFLTVFLLGILIWMVSIIIRDIVFERNTKIKRVEEYHASAMPGTDRFDCLFYPPHPSKCEKRCLKTCRHILKR
jgi:hypothetical protein